MHSGMNDYIKKPLIAEDLFEKISKYLTGRFN
jgi:CheY-like chemotaxis protein